MRISRSALVLLLAFSTAGAAPAPDAGRQAVKELEQLKKRLPDILAAWVAKEGGVLWQLNGDHSLRPELRLLRRINPDRAKGVILLACFDNTGKRIEAWDEMMTVFLTYQDGCWTTERIDTVTTSAGQEDYRRRFRLSLARLMLAIDEAAEK